MQVSATQVSQFGLREPAMPCPPEIAEDVECRQERIARAFQRDFVIAQRQHGLFQLRSLLKCLLNQILDRLSVPRESPRW